MFRKISESFEKMAVRNALKEGRLLCPDCGAQAGVLPAEWGQMMACPRCGTKSSLPEWVAKEELIQGRADLPPAMTKIRREGDGLGGTVWHIPAGGKPGFFIVFAAVWLGITLLVSGGFLMTILNGGEINGDMPEWVLIPFFGIFYAVGLGMLYAGLRQMFMRHRLTVSSGGVTLCSVMFGRRKEKSLQPGTVKNVAQKEFYQQNYKPVYGIEIKGTGGKLRFGSALTPEDKAWLVADVREVLFGRGEPELKMAVPGSAASRSTEVFSIKLPRPPLFGALFGLLFSAIAIGFMCIGVFVMDGDPLFGSEKGFLSALFSDDFRCAWLLLNSVFAGLGIFVFVTNILGARKDMRIEGNSLDISIRTYKRGLVVEDKSYPRSSITDIRAISTGGSGGSAWKRIHLIVGDKSEKLGTWVDGETADDVVREVRKLLV